MPPFDQTNILVKPHRDRSLLIIITSVVIFHALLLFWSILMHSESKILPPPPQRRLIVQTVALNQGRSTPSSVVALQENKPVKKKIIPDIIKEKAPPEVVKEKEEELIPVRESLPKSPASNEEKEVPAPPPEIPIPEIKKEPLKPVEDAAPKPQPIKTLEPAPAIAKVIPTKPEVKKTEIKKKIEEEKKPIIKTEVKKGVPQKVEIQKKITPSAKPQEKKIIQAPPRQDKPKKVEIDVAAIERQKKIVAEQQAAKAKQQKLLSQAQETIAKIDKSRDKVSRTNFSDSGFVASPGAITGLQVDSFSAQGTRQQLSPHEASYRDELASRLKLMLKLPEYGEVKIELILERSGKVSKITVKSSPSLANRKYIEKMLPTLTFHAFGTNFDQSPQFTFSITLCNDL